MDGITSSSPGSRAPLPLHTAPVAGGRPGLSTQVTLNTGQLSLEVNISRAGNELSQKVQDQSNRLTQIDPKLAEQYRAVVDLLNRGTIV